jgi:mono/diheme cytochrome c family protein
MVRTAVLALTVGAALVGSANAQSDLVKRGDYLVNGILTCGNCHSPKGPPAAIAGKDFSGGLSWDEPPFKVTAPNITPDKETGIGSWTDAQIKTLMRTGIRPNDVHVAMIMPTGFYHVMTDRDLDAVVAYLRTLKPVSNKVADPIYKMPQLEIVIPGGEKKFTEDMMSDKVKKGFYLVTIAHCMECHTPRDGPRLDLSRLGAGGRDLPDLGNPEARTVSRNITSDPDAGLGKWSDADIKAAILLGHRPDGTKLARTMPFDAYNRMSSDDVNAIVDYLRTLRPLK